MAMKNSSFIKQNMKRTVCRRYQVLLDERIGLGNKLDYCSTDEAVGFCFDRSSCDSALNLPSSRWRTYACSGWQSRG